MSASDAERAFPIAGILDHEAVLAVGHDFAGAVVAGRDHRQSGGQGLEHDQAARVVPGGKREHVGRGVQGRVSVTPPGTRSLPPRYVLLGLREVFGLGLPCRRPPGARIAEAVAAARPPATASASPSGRSCGPRTAPIARRRGCADVADRLSLAVADCRANSVRGPPVIDQPRRSIGHPCVRSRSRATSFDSAITRRRWSAYGRQLPVLAAANGAKWPSSTAHQARVQGGIDISLRSNWAPRRPKSGCKMSNRQPKPMSCTRSRSSSPSVSSIAKAKAYGE